MIDYDRLLEGKQNRRMANESRFLDRLDRLERKIEKECLIGELCREGKAVYYFWPAGGKYFENSNYMVVVDHIIKKGYVR
jgi:hypothetical protein